MDTLRRSLRFKDAKGEWIYRAQTDKEMGVLKGLGLIPSAPRRGPGRPRKNRDSSNDSP